MLSHDTKKALSHRDAEARAQQQQQVVLVNMPFSALGAPSIALGLLKAGLARRGIASRMLNFQFRFAEMMGAGGYIMIEELAHPQHLIREWIFSASLFQHPKNRDLEGYVREVLAAKTLDEPDRSIYSKACLDDLVAAMLKGRAEVEGFLNHCLETVLALKPKIVAFTSMFEQHLASVSLAKRIKSELHDCFVIFGGSNCEGMMGAETFRQFGFIDLLVSGEGDLVFPEIAEAILASKPVPRMTGVYNRRRPELPLANQQPQNAPSVEDLDELPFPDYDDYFEQLEASSLQLAEKPILFFETSRGCWWGEKLHCTFCGLNGATMAYRSKSPQRAFDELIYLTGRHPGCTVNAVDNILDMKYFKSFVKMLAERGCDFGLFYEVKSNLKKEQLRLLHKAGIRTIQPGIESLSDDVLRIMRKGVTALQNIQFIKWCTELGIKVVYNIIWGFPGETTGDYRKMLELIPLITHLRPPVGAGSIRIDRFSPNFNEHKAMGFRSLAPYPSYGYVYPFDTEVINNLAYFFVPEYEARAVERSATIALSKEVDNWKETYKRSELFFMDKGGRLLVWDLRPCAKGPLWVLDDYSRLVYLACDEARTVQQIRNSWESSRAPFDEAQVREKLESFVERSLMIKQGERYLSLAYSKLSDGERWAR